MSELKYMDLSLEETLKNLNKCRDVIADQEESITQFRDMILDCFQQKNY